MGDIRPDNINDRRQRFFYEESPVGRYLKGDFFPTSRSGYIELPCLTLADGSSPYIKMD